MRRERESRELFSARHFLARAKRGENRQSFNLHRGAIARDEEKPESCRKGKDGLTPGHKGVVPPAQAKALRPILLPFHKRVSSAGLIQRAYIFFLFSVRRERESGRRLLETRGGGDRLGASYTGQPHGRRPELEEV